MFIIIIKMQYPWFRNNNIIWYLQTAKDEVEDSRMKTSSEKRTNQQLRQQFLIRLFGCPTSRMNHSFFQGMGYLSILSRTPRHARGEEVAL